MNEEKTTLDWFIRVADAVRKVANANGVLFELITRDAKEIDKLNSIIDELRDENERLKLAAKGGDA